MTELGYSDYPSLQAMKENMYAMFSVLDAALSIPPFILPVAKCDKHSKDEHGKKAEHSKVHSVYGKDVRSEWSSRECNSCHDISTKEDTYSLHDRNDHGSYVSHDRQQDD